MGRQALTYGAILIGVYLALAYATQGGRLLTSGGGAISQVAKTLQGR